MDNPFQYDKYVTGKYFIGRRKDCDAITAVISSGENAYICAPRGCGKMSAVQQTLLQMKNRGAQFRVFSLMLTNIRDTATFVRRYRKLLTGEDLPAGTPISQDEVNAAAELPYRMAAESGKQVIVILNEFHNLGTEDGQTMIKAMEKAVSDNKDQEAKVSLIFMGSSYNAMEEIFRRRKFFYRLVSTIELTEFSETEIADHIIKGFTAGGKVIDRDLLIGACRIFGNNIWYVNNFFFICDSLSKGYISELTFSDALSCMLSVHIPRFTRIMDNLTDYQERMLKAVLDGVIKFSTTEVLDSYRLNSSANVKRLKDALMKKEVIAFNDKDEPFLPDTLFEYWLRKYYFGETPANTLKW